jgi:U3 small nucleolar RNA-associated protein 7
MDTSTGAGVTKIMTKHGPCDVMTHNPQNAVIHLGHHGGTMTLWTPNQHTPVVKVFCHKSPLTSIAVDPTGRYIVTSSMDARYKIWDIRKTYQSVDSYVSPKSISTMDISQSGLLSVGFGHNIQVWKDMFSGQKQKEPYMNHFIKNSTINQIAFCPFEDVLGIATDKGFSSILIPGSGEANFDSHEINPYQTKAQRGEKEVHSLLEKMQPQMITLNPEAMGAIDQADKSTLTDEKFDKIREKREKRKKKLQKKYANKKGSQTATAKAIMKANRITKIKKMTRNSKIAMSKQKGVGSGEKKKTKKEQSSALSRFKTKKFKGDGAADDE